MRYLHISLLMWHWFAHFCQIAIKSHWHCVCGVKRVLALFWCRGNSEGMNHCSQFWTSMCYRWAQTHLLWLSIFIAIVEGKQANTLHNAPQLMIIAPSSCCCQLSSSANQPKAPWTWLDSFTCLTRSSSKVPKFWCINQLSKRPELVLLLILAIFKLCLGNYQNLLLNTQ